MGLAAHLVLYGEQDLAGVEIDHVLEAIFVLIDLHGDEAELFKPPMRPGEVRNVNLAVVPIVRFLRRIGLAEVPVLLLAHLHAGFRRVSVLDDGRKRAHHLAIETRNAMRGAGTDVERDVRHAQHDTAKAVRVRRMHVDAVTPRADRLDTIVAFAEVELRSFQWLAYLRQAIEQRGAVRDDQSGDAAQHVRLPGRQMKLAYPDIDPHVAGAGIEEGVAREAETGDVIARGQLLVGDANIHVTEIDDVAEILRRAVMLVCHGAIPLRSGILSRSG